MKKHETLVFEHINLQLNENGTNITCVSKVRLRRLKFSSIPGYSSVKLKHLPNVLLNT